MLQHRTDPDWLVAEDHRKYAIKNIFHTEFEYQLDLQTPLRGCPNLRVVNDTVPEHLLFVYNYCTNHLLKLAENESLSDATRKRILRDTLVGIADLHERNILHGVRPFQDIKPDNIFVDYEETTNGATEVQRVQVGDLEMGSVIPPGLNVRGAKLSNPMWRSPESHAAARINLPTDVFSFGLVCIYTMLRKIIFRIDSEGLSRADEERLVVKRLLSHFGDGPGLVGLIDHLDDSVASWRDLVLDFIPEFTTTNPRKPFSMWVEVDEGFTDIVTKMTSLDPARRITAREALEHPWFQDLWRGHGVVTDRGDKKIIGPDTESQNTHNMPQNKVGGTGLFLGRAISHGQSIHEGDSRENVQQRINACPAAKESENAVTIGDFQKG
ncbi:hypothetical protein V501_01319 [Pseudogymnoascus sp. VKM F-4519 (FW-2642)]|nr:hypothetical protein V501_01319 [Pseudogymnoascus sp. VKM F-4519 (FW-2642)]